MILHNQSNVTFDYVLPDLTSESAEQGSNKVQTEILTYAVKRIKTSEKKFLKENNTCKQSIDINNNSATTLKSVLFKDKMSSGAKYVPGSVVVNGIPKPEYDPEVGFTLDDIPAGMSAKVEYTILSDETRSAEVLKNSGSITYGVDDPLFGTAFFTESTNEVEIPLISTRISVVKSVDKAFVAAGGKLHYTSVVTNGGSVLSNNIIFIDSIPVGTRFVEGSVKVDGTVFADYNPQNGFSIPELMPGKSSTVEFEVVVE